MTFRLRMIVTSMASMASMAAPAVAGPPLPPVGRGSVYSYATEASCRAAGRFTSDQCANAAANARAEFDEKAPRFSSRAACEQIFRAGCAVGFDGSAGWVGKKAIVYFQPRLSSFEMRVVSERDISVTPQIAGPAIAFSPRSALSRETRIDPKRVAARDAWRPGGGGGAAVYGVETPTGEKGAVPPRPPVDPNFNCAAVLEPGAAGDPSTGCYLAPNRH